MIDQLKKKRRELRAALDKMGELPRKEKRDMNEDESTKFDDLVAQIKALDTRIKALEDVDADDPDAEPEPRSAGIRSRPPGEQPRSRNPGFIPAPIGAAPGARSHSFGIHTGGDHETYSIHRSIECIASGHALDGLEGELSQHLSQLRAKPLSGNSFFMPLGADPEIRRMMYPNQERRDLTTVTGGGGIFNEPMMPLIDLLRARLVIRPLGATVLSGVHGLFSIPRQTGTGQVYWLGEGVPAALSNPALDQVPFTPKVAIAGTNLSRLWTAQTSVDAELFTQNDLANNMARELDRVAINGSGGTQPLGILQNPAIIARSASLQHGANGGPLTYVDTVKMKTKIATANADAGKLGFLTNPDMEGQLRLTTKIPPGQSGAVINSFVWEDGRVEGEGKVNGYRALTTTQVPNNLTKGSATNCSALIFGNWSDLIMALWDGVEMIINPYTNQMSGGVIISMNMTVDVEVRHAESFDFIADNVPAY